jgi:hypothetical protein
VPSSRGATVRACPAHATTAQHPEMGSAAVRSRAKGQKDPMSACQTKQADKAGRGASRQESEKLWRRKGCDLGKVAAGVNGACVVHIAKRTLPADGAEGDQTSGEAPPREWVAGFGRDADGLRARNVASLQCSPGHGQATAAWVALKRRKACERMILLRLRGGEVVPRKTSRLGLLATQERRGCANP